MGQALTKCFNPDAAGPDLVGPIDHADLRPRGLYPNQSDFVNNRVIKKLILQGNIAPCYLGAEEDPDGTVSPEHTAATLQDVGDVVDWW